MEDEMLIEEICQCKELYDMTHKKYSNNIHKDNGWRKIYIIFFFVVQN
jgi:hypothetical protein